MRPCQLAVVTAIVLHVTPPASAQEDEPERAGDQALRDWAIDQFFDRCEAEPTERARELAAVDWEMLHKLGFTSGEIVDLAESLPEGCEYASFKAAMLAERRLAVEEEDEGEVDDDDGFIQYRPVLFTLSRLQLGLTGVLVGGGAVRWALAYSLYSAGGLSREAEDFVILSSRRCLGLGALSVSRLIPTLISGLMAGAARDNAGMYRAIATPYVIFTALDLTYAVLSIADGAKHTRALRGGMHFGENRAAVHLNAGMAYAFGGLLGLLSVFEGAMAIAAMARLDLEREALEADEAGNGITVRLSLSPGLVAVVGWF